MTGGLSRQNTLVKELLADQRDPDEQSLIVNTGNNVHGTGPEKAMLSQTIMQVFNLMAPACIGIGTGELSLGRNVLEQAALKDLPLVFSNAQDDSKGLFKPYVVLNKNGIKVLVASIIDPEEFTPALGIIDFKASSPLPALRKLKSTIDHDVFVLVAHTRVYKAKNWVKEVKGIDILIMGSDLAQASCTEEPFDEQDNRDAYIFMANRSRASTICYADVLITDKNISLVDSGNLSVKEDKLEDYQSSKIFSAYKIWNRKRELERTGPEFFSQVNNKFNYFEYIKKRGTSYEER